MHLYKFLVSISLTKNTDILFQLRIYTDATYVFLSPQSQYLYKRALLIRAIQSAT